MRAFRRSLPMALLKAREAVMARFRPLLHEHDLTEQQWRVLRALTTADEFRAGELARVSSISMPSLSRILRTLEKRGLIQRGIEDKDLRAAQISITPSGRDMIALIAPPQRTALCRDHRGLRRRPAGDAVRAARRTCRLPGRSGRRRR